MRSIFNISFMKREKKQVKFHRKSGLCLPTKKEKKISMNITLPADYKEKLQCLAAEKHLSASVLIQMWIEKHCN